MRRWLLVLSLVALVSCSANDSTNQPDETTTTEARPTQAETRTRVDLGENFPMVASECDGDNRVYLAASGDNIDMSVIETHYSCWEAPESSDPMILRFGESMPKVIARCDNGNRVYVAVGEDQKAKMVVVKNNYRCQD